MFTKKETKKKKTGQQKTRRRGVVVATFFNRSRTLYVKGKRVPAGLFFSPSSAGENGGALSSPLSLASSGALLRVFLSLSLFLSENSNSIRLEKHTNVFFRFPIVCARIQFGYGCARARKKMQTAEIQTRVSDVCAHFAHTSRARITFRCSLGRSVCTLFLSLFSSLSFACFKRYS